MSAYVKPYSKSVTYWCDVCGNEWHDNHIGECWMMCEGCANYVKRKTSNFYFEDTDDEGYYCKECAEEKKEERENPETKQPEE